MGKRSVAVGIVVAVIAIAGLIPVGSVRGDTYQGTSTAGCVQGSFTVATMPLDGTIAYLSANFHLILDGSGGREVAGFRWVVNGQYGPATYLSATNQVQDWWLTHQLYSAALDVYLNAGTTGTAKLVVSEPYGYGGCFRVDSPVIFVTHFNNAGGGGSAGGGGGGIATPSASATASPTPPAGSPNPSSSPPAGWCYSDGYDPNTPGTGAWVPCESAPPAATNWSEELGGDFLCEFGTNTSARRCYSWNTGMTAQGYQGVPPAKLRVKHGRSYVVKIYMHSRGTLTISQGEMMQVTVGKVSGTGNTNSFTGTGYIYTETAGQLDAFNVGDVLTTYNAGPIGGSTDDYMMEFSVDPGNMCGTCVGTVRFHVTTSGGDTPSPTPWPSFSSQPSPSSYPVVPSEHPPSDSNQSGFDVCDPQYVNAHGSELCQERPSYGTPAVSMDPDGFDALISALQSKAPFGYAAQAVTALTEAAGNAEGAAAPDCTTLPVWLGGDTTEDAELCVPWDEVAGWSSGVRPLLAAMLTIAFGISLLMMANGAAKGRG